MAIYTIEQLSKVTGISKQALRAWGNRYDYLSGNRTKTNIRFYNDDHLIRAINTTSLLKLGYKISKIATLSDVEVQKILLGSTKNTSHGNEDIFINALLKSCVTYDSKLFDLTFSRGLLKYGIIEFYTSIILPALSKIGLFWLVNNLSPAQEHFFSELLKERIAVETNNFALEESVNPSWVLFLPPDEYHELGLLMAKLILRKQNLKVYYFGSSLPFESITEINNEIKPENVLYFILSKKKAKDLEKTMSNVEEGFPNSNISVVCNSNQLTKFGKTQIINDVGQFVSLIKE